jgi:4-amino-4-deoxy-L-arabinose transferase-like glycosyltransferase
MRILKDRSFLFVVVFLIFILISLYIGVITHYWKITPDSTTYIAGAESFASGKGYLERGKPASPFPPLTSLIFSIFILIFSKNYLVLNTVVTFFTFFSLILVFFLFLKTIGHLKSALIILLSIGSILLFTQSTFLLSDIFYLFFSVSVIFAAGELLKKRQSSLSYFTVGILLVSACMTRSAGMTLIFAVLLCVFVSLLQKKIKLNPLLFFSICLPLLSVFLWGIRNSRLGISYFKVVLQHEAHVPELGYISLLDFLERVFTNIGSMERIGSVLINTTSDNFWVVIVLAKVICLGLFLVGFFLSLKKEINVQNLYIGFYLLLLFSIRSGITFRLLIPVLPFLFYYALLGAQFFTEKMRSLQGNLAPKIILAAGALYILVYLGIGITEIVRIIPEERRSPFGSYRIKYTDNYDIQKLALWLRDNSSQEDSYVSQHPNVMDFITERKGYFFPFSYDQGRLLDRIKTNDIDYILVDKNKLEVNNFLIPVIEAHPDMFDLIQDEERASLYKVVFQAESPL